jgi:hypothetical protein
MALWQSTLSRGTSRIQDVVEPGEATSMYVLILVRVLIRVRMLDHASSRLRFENDPRTVALFQAVGNLHTRPLGRTGLGPEFNFGVRLIAVDGNTSDIHLHGAHVERANSGEVLHDSGANGVVVTLLLLTSAGG